MTGEGPSRLEDIQVAVDSEDELEAAQAAQDEEEGADETESTLMTVVMFAGLVVFAAGCYFMGWMG